MTFSIVAVSDDGAWLGVGTASRALAVGAAVPALRPGAGALASQAYTNREFRGQGLDLLAGGAAPDDVVASLRETDPGAGRRQLAVVDVRGRSAVWTGEGCTGWAGARALSRAAVAGNILTGSEVLDAMQDAWQGSRPAVGGQTTAVPDGVRSATDGATAFADRLLDVLVAGQSAGGDARGRQSAAVRVVKADGVVLSPPTAAVDLRVDDHADPLGELARLLRLLRAEVDAARHRSA